MAQRNVRVGNIGGVSGEVNIAAGNIIKNIQTIYERALSPAETAEKELQIELKELAQGVRGYLERLKQQVIADTTSAPYKGLEAYTLSDAEVFFGRDQAIRDLREAMRRGPLTVLQAESGAGKTSLLQAGIVPHLMAEEHLAVLIRPQFENPTDAIKKSFIGNLGSTPKLARASLVDFLRRVKGIIGHHIILYVILDQFEEFFAKYTLEEDRQLFILDLAECLNDATLNVRWVISITTDSFGQLGKFEPHIRNPFSNAQSLYLFNQQEAAAVIAKPAQRHGLSFEDGLLEQLLNDLDQNHDELTAPTQIQLVCAALYDDIKDKSTVFTRALYDQKGGAQGILHGYIGSVLRHDLPHEERAAAYKILEALVTSEKKRVIRGKIDLETALQGKGIASEMLESTLNHLVSRRLLRRLGDDAEHIQYEIVHDYLLREIEINEDVRNAKEAEELLDQGTKRWQKPEKMLLSSEEVGYIEKFKDKLFYPDIQLKLLIRSAAYYSRPFRYFLDRLEVEAKRKFVLDLCAELETGNTRDKRIARKILVTIRSGVPRDALLKSYAWYLPRYGMVLVAFIIISYFIFSSLRVFLLTPEASGWQPTNTFADQTGVASKKLVLALDPLNPDLIFAADPNDTGGYKSTNGGLNWSPTADETFQNESVKGVAVIDGLVYVITDSQIFSSADSGVTWTEKANPSQNPDETLVFVALNLYSRDEVYVGSSTGKLFLSSNRANKWTGLPTNGMAGTQIRAIAVNNKLLLVATEGGLWEYDRENSMWKEISLRECLNMGAKSADIVAVVIPRATYSPDEADFTVSVSNFGLCNSDTKGEFESITYPDQPSKNIYSIAITGDLNAFEAQVYLSADSGMYCGRVWYANEREWWYKKINKLLGRNIFPLPCPGNDGS